MKDAWENIGIIKRSKTILSNASFPIDEEGNLKSKEDTKKYCNNEIFGNCLIKGVISDRWSDEEFQNKKKEVLFSFRCYQSTLGAVKSRCSDSLNEKYIEFRIFIRN